eukprot:scaffold14246_cov105-Isochrysis_galbana.AAC.8
MSPSLRHAYNTPSMAGRAGMSAWGSCSAEQGSCGSARCTVSSERRVRVGVGGAVEGAPRDRRRPRSVRCPAEPRCCRADGYGAVRRWGDDEAEAAADEEMAGEEAAAVTEEALPEGEAAVEKMRA